MNETRRHSRPLHHRMATELAQDETLVRAVFDAVAALENAGLDYIVIGGLASSLLGRPRTTRDVDLLVHQDDALRALDALALVGFATEETNPSWIYKAMRGDVTIDVIFWLKGDVYLDDEMLARQDFVDFAVAWWPPLAATDVLGWLRDPELLARVGDAVLTPEEQRLLSKSWGDGVDLGGVDGEAVAGVGRHEDCRSRPGREVRLEDAAQPADVGVQRAVRPGRGVLPPDEVD